MSYGTVTSGYTDSGIEATAAAYELNKVPLVLVSVADALNAAQAVRATRVSADLGTKAVVAYVDPDSYTQNGYI